MQWTINSENSVFLSILLYSGKMCAKQPNNKCNGLLIVKIAFSYLIICKCGRICGDTRKMTEWNKLIKTHIRFKERVFPHLLHVPRCASLMTSHDYITPLTTAVWVLTISQSDTNPPGTSFKSSGFLCLNLLPW